MPFFIVGCGRSGTTLLRVLLNRHPEVAIPLESLFMVDYLRYQGPLKLPDQLQMVLAEPEIEEWGIEVDPEDYAQCRTMTEVIEYLNQSYAASHRKSQWGQKTPRFVRHMDILIRHFPEGRFIHVVRDPRAVVNSLMRSNVHYNNALTGTWRWLRDVNAGLDFERSNPEKVLRIKYEDLVLDTKPILERVCEFLSLPWPEEGWWRGTLQAKEEYSRFYDQIHANLDGPISSTPISKWQGQLHERDVALVEQLAGELMTSLGYQPSLSGLEVSKGYVRWLKAERWLGLARRVWQYLRRRRGYLWYVPYRKWRLGFLPELLRGRI